MRNSSSREISSTGESRWKPEEDRIRDAYARRGNLFRYSWLNPAHLLGMQEVERGILDVLARQHSVPLERARVLDIGCGTGVWLREFIKWGARPENVFGVDLLGERIKLAKRVCPATVTLECANAAQLPFESGSFDVVFQSMLFSSVLDQEMRARIAREMVRLVRPDGLVLWYDYHVNNPQNADVRRVGLAEIRKLFPGCSIHLRRITLAPPLARFAAPKSTAIYRLLNAIPLLRTHYLGTIRRPVS
jgi:SAM-dependent methyltransferase